MKTQRRNMLKQGWIQAWKLLFGDQPEPLPGDVYLTEEGEIVRLDTSHRKFSPGKKASDDQVVNWIKNRKS